MADRPPRDKARWVGQAEVSSIGIEIALSIVFGALGGYYLEQHVTHWSPWTMLIGLAFGIGAAINALVRTSRDYQRRTRGSGGADSREGPTPEKRTPAHESEDP